MRIIVGISGASGVIMGYHLVRALKRQQCEVHLVISNSARETWAIECDMPISQLETIADVVHSNDNLAAAISSGSFETAGMIVLPCSMKTLAAAANGYSDGLLTRAVDVCLKENRKVVLCPREMPFGKVHLRNMLATSELGCTIIAPLLTFYNHAQNLDEQIEHLIGKIFMQFNLNLDSFKPWEGCERNR